MSIEDQRQLAALAEKAREEQARPKDCDHADWTFKKQGRVCWKCRAFMVDFGD